MRANTWTLGLGIVVVAVLAMVAAGPSRAEQVPEGFYVGAGGGLNLNDSGDFDIQGVGRDLNTDLGFVGLVNFGYAFGNGLRAEIEGGYRQNGVDEWGGVGLDGDLSAWHTMLNAIYDFDTGTSLTPYVGAGLGAAIVSIDAENNAAGVRMDDTDVGFAYQAILGAAYDITENVAVTADYRFFHAVDLDHEISDGRGGGPGDDYLNHSLVIGVRYAFGKPSRPQTMPAAATPPPQVAPAPAPAPSVPTSYLVFFDFDSANLTPEATSIVDTAASNALQVGRTRIEVTGHTDRAGSRQYNMVLSQRRANAVMERLVAQGIPRSEIAVFARGEDEPLIPTGDGMREAQNRRVEIILL
ncbi:OmpA family protein [Roseospira goensis]|uniref:Outer membrane protein OmpA-like peptidoglycan-associated protein n=1 Tax=Roseospira goensis TaxID=391922 RepID=A0A7W6RZS2_9PROT|nr:outer membrane beta-barrel protein [Roseospira goensis]MBB4286091.1 outer membrane protein OmpA-like peptidoglycan-associated protein [Roseospira goensis]